MNRKSPAVAISICLSQSIYWYAVNQQVKITLKLETFYAIDFIGTEFQPLHIE